MFLPGESLKEENKSWNSNLGKNISYTNQILKATTYCTYSLEKKVKKPQIGVWVPVLLLLRFSKSRS